MFHRYYDGAILDVVAFLLATDTTSQPKKKKNHPVPLLFIKLVCSAFITSLHSPLISKSRNICLTRPPGPVKRQIPPEGSKSLKYAPASARTRMKLADSGKLSEGNIRAEDRESGDCERKTTSRFSRWRGYAFQNRDARSNGCAWEEQRFPMTWDWQKKTVRQRVHSVRQERKESLQDRKLLPQQLSS